MDSGIDIVHNCVTLEQIWLKWLIGQFRCSPALPFRQGLLLFTGVSSGFSWHQAPRTGSCSECEHNSNSLDTLVPSLLKTKLFSVFSSRWGHSPSAAPLAKTELFGCDVEFFTFSVFFCSHLSNCNRFEQLQQQTYLAGSLIRGSPSSSALHNGALWRRQMDWLNPCGQRPL